MIRRYIRICNLIVAYLLAQQICAQSPVPDPSPQRFQSEISAFIHWDQKNSTPDNAVLFVGSSSIRMLKTRESFPHLPVINRGFGGAHISDLLYYYNDIIEKFDINIIIFFT